MFNVFHLARVSRFYQQNRQSGLRLIHTLQQMLNRVWWIEIYQSHFISSLGNKMQRSVPCKSFKSANALFTVKSLIYFYFQMKTTKYTSIYISMFNESIVPLLYYVYLINPHFKLYCFFFFWGGGCFVFFFGGGGGGPGVTLFQFPKTEGAAFHFAFP